MSKKLELFKVPVLLVIIGRIIGLIRFFDFFCLQQLYHLCEN